MKRHLKPISRLSTLGLCVAVVSLLFTGCQLMELVRPQRNIQDEEFKARDPVRYALEKAKAKENETIGDQFSARSARLDGITCVDHGDDVGGGSFQVQQVFLSEDDYNVIACAGASGEYKLPLKWRPGMKIRVRRSEFYSGAYIETFTTIPPYADLKPGNYDYTVDGTRMWLHFFPNFEVRAVVTPIAEDQPGHPIAPQETQAPKEINGYVIDDTPPLDKYDGLLTQAIAKRKQAEGEAAYAAWQTKRETQLKQAYADYTRVGEVKAECVVRGPKGVEPYWSGRKILDQENESVAEAWRHWINWAEIQEPRTGQLVSGRRRWRNTAFMYECIKPSYAEFGLPLKWRPGLKVRVEFGDRNYPRQFEKRNPKVMVRYATIPPYQLASTVWVHIFPNDEVRVVVSEATPDEPGHPIPPDMAEAPSVINGYEIDTTPEPPEPWETSYLWD